ncbi:MULTISPECIES: hypothetical protein [unclassified Pseudomonas]|uniref:hypothetical protein n=1 Tax=unclassified Pseudomonas TaxID=196821 RepID=UPI001F42D4BE|nr:MULTISPECIES: hypothetical protein [unclassified Pseudomonas]MCF5233099.1 hypothetical protein [Pseudomonas sp. PA-5-4H]MCF5237406.1 hypothetical protein [Pseudomonas sp. PA-5-4G]MCF5245980.1 hypothetical protein [Pseudomonas sp. PA-5-4B]MCF5252692.1 hypothetical protein [Pseudomonas sp. PA-5-4B]MCF5257961.1 hypothetical protein [Pseudomonas sp. PA-5-4A]
MPFAHPKVSSKRKAIGVYEVRGTLGLIPMPPAGNGWGYSMGVAEKDISAVVTYSRKVLTVKLYKDGQPYDLVDAMSLHTELMEPEPTAQPVI